MPSVRRLNLDAQENFEEAPQRLRQAWGWGGDDADGDMRVFADWFEEIVDDLIELYNDGDAWDETCEYALEGCSEMLELTHVNHGRHIGQIVRLRRVLAPGITFYDWPCDVSRYYNDNEEDFEGVFHMDL
ncbi:hypothetical protein M231_05812 [Tremella mesenterica]|uniref:Uncharacterized protein n=1 Tax=Tremella mesenterica TaxID=5217 RepID=A0A4Q1BH55_TREME|nr:uncharacterized protein TREMEDRAFT_60857 [Tremella mesenterica DSM 1558]EIW70364.1 hypothetical protein TREMEDRAFT_60857 [Tremella mesenterica DSM 1558]RXK36910.1 hypothetical protein M231_05812 [Tremella mesenterica]